MRAGVLGRSVLHCADPAVFARNSPSLFADPVAWLVCAAVEAATEECADELSHAREDVGVIVVSEFATLTTMRSVAGGAAHGRVSPLRFAGANPAVVAGLACITLGFRGPTLTLSMSPADGVGPAAAVASSVLSSGAAGHLVLAAHQVTDEHVATCVVVGTRMRPADWRDVRRHLAMSGAPEPA
jgi:hypothetical protein